MEVVQVLRPLWTDLRLLGIEGQQDDPVGSKLQFDNSAGGDR
jgi:hypothetical protein